MTQPHEIISSPGPEKQDRRGRRRGPGIGYVRGGIFLYVVFLAVLFLMCSTDLIIREPEKEIYQVAVIIEDARDDNYGNFRKGMDQAAVELNADVRFITLYEKLDAAQQMEMILREQQDGTDALIVVPADEKQVIAALASKQVTTPVVLLGSELMGEGVAGVVAVDYKEMGAVAARQIIGHTPKDCPVLILEDREKKSDMSRRFQEGAAKELEDAGYNYETVESLEGRVRAGEGENAVILAENPQILTEAARILADNPHLSEHILGLYGRGTTMQILNDLDRGVITGVCAADDFGIGYLSVCMAVRALEESGSQRPVTMECWYIEKEDLKDPVFEAMLYPIE